MHDFGVNGRPGSQMTEISGRRSPVVGQHGIPGYFYSSPSPVVSPLPIMQGFKAPAGLSHPAPQPVSQEQLAAWTFNRATPYPYTANQQPSYGTLSHPASVMPDVHDPPRFFHNFSGSNTECRGWVPMQDDSSEPHVPSGMQHVPAQYGGRGRVSEVSVVTETRVETAGAAPMKTLEPKSSSRGDRGYKVYWQRWLMLMYMSVLNLLSDWTCYSVAPISMLTEEAFGNIDPERLVVVFLGANAIASISEPVILSRLGLRRTILFGALLLMIGSIIKSGGVPPILQSDIVQGESAWRL